MMPVKRFIAILVSLTFVFSTLLQYHHHDRMGNIFITFSFIGEIELGFHQHKDCSCHHIHNKGTMPDDCGDDEDCSMHLDESLSTDADDLASLPLPVVLNLEFIFPGCLGEQSVDISGECLTDFAKRDISLPLFPDISACRHRGPPVLA